MNEQQNHRERQRQREKAAFLYSSALEQGDFERVTAVLAEAGQDEVLAQMIMELDEAYEKEWTDDENEEAAPRSRRWMGAWRGRWQRVAWVTGTAVMLFGLLLWLAGLRVSTQTPYLATTFDYMDLEDGYSAYAPQTLADSYTLNYGVALNSAAANESQQRLPEAFLGVAERNFRVQQQETEDSRLIIREGAILLWVADPSAVRNVIEARIATMADAGGFVVDSEEVSRGSSPPVATVDVRVPADQFAETMDWLASLSLPGTNPTRSESAQDITEEFVDLETRLESMQAARDRLLAIMEDADTTADLLRVEAQLTERDAEIESLQGRIQFLAQAAALSRIQIELQPYGSGRPLNFRWQPGERAEEAVATLVNSLQQVGNFLIFFVIAVLPWAAVISAILIALIRLVRRRIIATGE